MYNLFHFIVCVCSHARAVCFPQNKCRGQRSEDNMQDTSEPSCLHHFFLPFLFFGGGGDGLFLSGLVFGFFVWLVGIGLVSLRLVTTLPPLDSGIPGIHLLSCFFLHTTSWWHSLPVQGFIHRCFSLPQLGRLLTRWLNSENLIAKAL